MIGCALITALVLLLSSQSFAGAPSRDASVIPCGIVLVGTNAAGVPDPIGAFTIVARTDWGNPVNNYPLTLDFSDCSDVSICSAQLAQGGTVYCEKGLRTITFPMRLDGTWTITLIGGAVNGSRLSTGCMRIIVGPVALADPALGNAVTVAALDQTGGDGLNMADFSVLLSDVLSGKNPSRSNFGRAAACQSNVNAADLSIWLESFLTGYVEGCSSKGASLCP